MTPRGSAVIALLALLAVFVVLSVALIPWRESPVRRADQLAALRSLPPEQVARGFAFAAARRPPTYASMIVALATALVLGLTPIGAHIVTDVGRPFDNHWTAQAALGGLVIIFIGSLITVPFGAWRHTIMRRFGLATQGWGGWAIDLLKGYAITVLLGGAALLAFYGIVRASPRWWWAWGAAVAAGLMVLLSFIVPVVIEPIFNKFAPMPDGPLRSALMRLASRDGVPVKDVLVADASRRTRAVNAYVSGFAATRRIVVYDTLIEQATQAEVESVVAHELGHAKDKDVVIYTLVGALGTAISVIVIYLLGGWSWLLAQAGVTGIGEPRSIALLLAIGAIGGLISAPLQNVVSRHIEARADTHALMLTNDPVTFEQMQARLSHVNISNVDPNRFEFVMFASHPSTVQRIAAAIAFGQTNA